MKAPPIIPVMPPTLVAQISSLSQLHMDDIKSLWRRLFAAETPTHNRQFLERRIAYKLQEVECRKSNAALLERNRRRIVALVETGKLKKRDRDYRPVAGTVLTREYQKVEYRVTVSADEQYEFEGRLYPSLSVIAREITGTRWSGPLFFGLKTLSKPKKGAAK
ncbi:MAG: DUF2924 domain-containing protein [Burkholderiaceae bacterium]